MIEELFKKHLRNSIIGFALSIGVLISGLLSFVISDKGMIHDSFGFHEDMNDTEYITGICLLLFIGALRLWYWGTGIHNARRINFITKKSKILIFFSIFPLMFCLLIITIVQKNKFKGFKFEAVDESPTTQSDSFETKLKESFMHGIITAAEYEKKLKDHQNVTKK